MSGIESNLQNNVPVDTHPQNQPITVEAQPTFKERVMGEAKVLRGTVTRNDQLKAEGEELIMGVSEKSASTNKAIEAQSAQSLDELDVHRPTGGMKGTATEGQI